MIIELNLEDTEKISNSKLMKLIMKIQNKKNMLLSLSLKTDKNNQRKIEEGFNRLINKSNLMQIH